MITTDNLVISALETIGNAIGSIPKKYHASIASFFGRLSFHIDKRHRKITLDNLLLSYKDQLSDFEATFLSKKIFINLSRFLLEICWAKNLDQKALQGYLNVEEIHFIKKALEKKRGVLILTGHLGNWELAPYVLAFEGIKGNGVYRPLDYMPADKLIFKTRSRFGTGLIPSRHAVKKIFSALKNNECVGLLVDQGADTTNGVIIDFFDRRTFGNKGLSVLALKTGAPVVPGFLIRDGEKFRFVSGPEIPLIKTGDRQKDIEINTQQYNSVIEKFIRQYPDQWFWVHRRWKTPVSSPWPRKEES